MLKGVIFAIGFVFYFPAQALAQGHGLCSNSAGFQKAMHILDSDEMLRYISQKIRLNQDLSTDEYDFFYAAYQSAIQKDAAEIKAEISTFGISLSSVDQTLAMRLMLEDGVDASTAVDKATTSRAARYASTSRPPADAAITSVLDGKENVYIGGVRLSDSTKLIIRAYGARWFANTRSIAMRGELFRYLAPDQYEALFNSPSVNLRAIYDKFNQFNVGDVEILFYRYKPMLLKDEFSTAGQTVLVQRVSYDKMVLYNPIGSSVNFFDVKDVPLSFEKALGKDSIALFNKDMDALVRAYSLPDTTPMELYTRLTTIEKMLRNFGQNFAGFPESLKVAFTAGGVRPVRYMLNGMDFSQFFGVFAYN